VPNIACEECSECNLKCNGENYCPNVKFASSNYDGFSREYLSFPVRNLVLINGIETEVAVFLELMSVANAAIERINIENYNKVAIFGDGIVGYILCCVLKSKFNGKIIVVGKHKDKIEKFPAQEKVLLKELNEDTTFDIAFECVGGNGMEDAIESILRFIDIGGSVVLTGVSENSILINTRRILEKKISICGSTRSTVQDFKTVVNLILNDKELYNEIKKLKLETLDIRNINDFYNAFEKEIQNKKLRQAYTKV
jgi:ribitol-5-phosphate 2-dehydrogenase